MADSTTGEKPKEQCIHEWSTLRPIKCTKCFMKAPFTGSSPYEQSGEKVVKPGFRDKAMISP